LSRLGWNLGNRVGQHHVFMIVCLGRLTIIGVLLVVVLGGMG
jgi:hypothetical protein